MDRSLSRFRTALKIALRLIPAFIALVLLLAVAGRWWWDRQLFTGYDPALPLEPEVTREEAMAGFRTERIVITGLKGERLPMRLILPASAGKGEPVRCVVFLYGIGQNLKFFRLIAPAFAARGMAMAMPEQYNRGERRLRGLGPVEEAVALRERASRLVPETRRVVDYLLSREDIRQVEFMGASYGGMFGCAVMAHEPRFASGTLIMAAGDFSRIFPALVRRYHPSSNLLWPSAARLAGWWLAALDPMHFVGRITPRPLLFLNVNTDELFDRDSLDALYQAAGPPREIRWHEGSHNAISEKTVTLMLEDSLSWLESNVSSPRGVEPADLSLNQP